MADGLIKEMPGVDLVGLSRTIFDLYRAGREVRYERFQPTALALIKELLPFDSAWWGNAAAEPMEIHRLYLFNCDKSILEAYTPYMEQDFFRAALMAEPGVSVNMADLVTGAQYVRTALYRNVGKRYKVEWSLGTLHVEPVSSLYEFLTLWKHDRKKPFSEPERQTKELLMPHLSEAHRVARLRQVLEGGNALNVGGPWWMIVAFCARQRPGLSTHCVITGRIGGAAAYPSRCLNMFAWQRLSVLIGQHFGLRSRVRIALFKCKT